MPQPAMSRFCSRNQSRANSPDLTRVRTSPRSRRDGKEGFNHAPDLNESVSEMSYVPPFPLVAGCLTYTGQQARWMQCLWTTTAPTGRACNRIDAATASAWAKPRSPVAAADHSYQPAEVLTHLHSGCPLDVRRQAPGQDFRKPVSATPHRRGVAQLPGHNLRRRNGCIGRREAIHHARSNRSTPSERTVVGNNPAPGTRVPCRTSGLAGTRRLPSAVRSPNRRSAPARWCQARGRPATGGTPGGTSCAHTSPWPPATRTSPHHR